MATLTSKTTRILLGILGFGFVGVGIVGIFLPILPTTPFLLLAAACFAKSSDRFHSALLNNRTFGPIISEWQQHRCVPKKAKKQAILTIIAVFSFSVLFIVKMLVIRILLVVVAIALISFLLRIPSREDKPLTVEN